QDFTRFELPLRDNVAPAGAPDDAIERALAEAGAASLAALDTVLARGYPGGTDLSGGQWQRVALARALCAVRLGAGLVLLDEAAPLLLSVAFGLSLLAALPDALLALWFKLLADGVLGARRGLVVTAAVGLGVSAAATWFLRVISDRTQRRFRDQVTIALESHV